MKQPNRAKDVYAAVDELADEVKGRPFSRLGEMLNHRVHAVAWTSRSALLEELASILV